MSAKWKLEIVSGFFEQDREGAVPKSLPERFGLLDSTPERWSNFQVAFEKLVRESEAEGVQVKLFVLGRHGQGYHNLAEEKYGTKAWDDYWSLLNGDDEMTWGPDPELTPLGIQQAKDAAQLWQTESTYGIMTVDMWTYYCSPLTRSLKTCEITFESKEGVKVLVVESCREENGIHTCDKRRRISEVKSEFPAFDFDPDMTEEDELWKPDVRETAEEVKERIRELIERIFEKDQGKYVSITAHSGFINGFLKAVNHPRYVLGTGGIIPVIVKAIPNA